VKIDARLAGRELRTGTRQNGLPAGPCPASAIEFGDLRDPDASRVVRRRLTPRNYALLED